MAGEAQPLDQQFPIVDNQGRPTQYFIRWAQERQIDIKDAVPSDRQIIAGRALGGGGALSADVTIDHDESLVVPGTYGDATHVAQFVVDQEGHVQGVVLVRLGILTAGGSLKVPVSTVAALPSAVTEGDGAIRAVNNANAPVLGSAVAGGGTVHCLVLSDGANWIVA